MTISAEGWGGGPWGETPWGTGEVDLELVGAIAVRENAVRLEFNASPVFDRLLTPHDASNPSRYAVTAVSGIGLDGEPVRAVLPVHVEVAPVEFGGGRFLDLYVDRPFTAYPAVYRVTANNLIASGGGAFLVAGASATFFGVRAGTPPPTPEHTSAMKDLLIAQGVRDLEGSNVPGNPNEKLGKLVANSRGDFASATPLAAYRTRVIRRAVTLISSFAHLPLSYGTPIAVSVKKPSRSGQAEVIAAQIEQQVRLEPETTSCTVTVNQTNQGVTTYRIVAFGRIGNVDVTVPG